MSDLRLDFAGLLADNVPACGDMATAKSMLRELPTLQAPWDGEFDLSANWMEWYLRTFLGTEEAGRVLRAMRAVRLSARGRVPLDVVKEIELGVLRALHPSCFQVAAASTKHPANQVAAGLERLGATEARWRKRYS